jgi:hypothetical protein
MKYLTIAILAILVAACSSATSNNFARSAPSGSTPAADRAGEIVAEFLKRDSARYKKNRIRFTVTEPEEPVKIVEIETSRRRTPDETVTYTEIISPAEDRGLGSLTIEAKDKKAVVVTYAASREEFRETGTEKMFIGGLTAGELLGEWEKFDYKMLGEKEIDGVKAFEIEARLKPSTDSIASRMTVVFRSDNYLPVELHSFGPDGKEIRTYKTTEIKGGPDHPFSARIEADNFVYKTHIFIERLTNEYPEKMDDGIFARDRLKQTVRK